MADLITTCQILNSYFLHEISGPLSAISSTTDLLISPNKKFQNDAFNLIVNGATDLCNKVKFYSYVYSISSQNDDYISFKIIKKLCEGLLAKTMVKLECTEDLLTKELASELSKTIMCLIITSYNNLSKEGIITLSIDTDKRISIKAVGKLLKIHQDKIKILTEDLTKSEPSIYNCNEYYSRLLNDKNGYIVSIKQFPDIIEYVIIDSVKLKSKQSNERSLEKSMNAFEL